jgi:hypothetical protein
MGFTTCSRACFFSFSQKGFREKEKEKSVVKKLQFIKRLLALYMYPLYKATTTIVFGALAGSFGVVTNTKNYTLWRLEFVVFAT